MVDYSFKNCLSLFEGRLKTLLRALSKPLKLKKTKNKRLSSSFDSLTSSFPATEVSNQFQLVFKLIDTNGDGKISPYELKQVLFCLGYSESKATREAEGMIREMDCNGDGLVDFDEFIDAVNNDGGLGSGSEEDYLMDAFLIFDADNNGLISAKELQNVLSSLGCDNCSLQQCRQMIEGVDKDGDGFVDFEEFRSMMMETA